jgi:hypothetical protein
LARIGRLACVAVTFLVFLVAPARAEEPAEKPFEEPGVSYEQRRDPYVEWIAGTLLGLACVFVAFKNPHRSHLD